MDAQTKRKELLRPDEVKDFLNVSRSTVYNMIADGRLEAVRIAGRTLRVTREAINQVVASTMDD